MTSKLKQASNISPNVIQETCERLTDLFGEPPVVIGGRAVNIYCFHERRDTHDIDVAVKQDPSEIPNFFYKAVEMGFIPRTEDEKAGGKMVGVTDRETGAQVDFFFKETIGGVEKSDVFEMALDRTLTKRGTTKVVDPGLLVLMKYTANRDKDWEDVGNLMRNVYGNSPSVFLKEESEKVKKYVPADQQKLFVQNLISATKAPFTSELRTS